MTEFVGWPKISRYNRETIITEKIDGTNAAILIEKHPFGTAEIRLADPDDAIGVKLLTVVDDPSLDDIEHEYHVYAQSRTRLLTATKVGDNFGFATWVQANAVELVKLLGVGRHFGEWYGQGIQRGYGLDHRRFALFNVTRWRPLLEASWAEPWRMPSAHIYQLTEDLPVDMVPMIATNTTLDGSGYLDLAVPEAVSYLRSAGSVLVPGFRNPEGIVIFHTVSQHSYKVTLEGDEKPKGAS